jgi:putative DNA primase/helicase
MIFTERAGGVARRRVIFQFNRVRGKDKAPDLSEKISAEIRLLSAVLANFSDPKTEGAFVGTEEQ